MMGEMSINQLSTKYFRPLLMMLELILRLFLVHKMVFGVDIYLHNGNSILNWPPGQIIEKPRSLEAKCFIYVPVLQ